MHTDMIRLLFVDDSEEDVELALRALARKGLAVTSNRVDTEAALRRTLADSPPHAILCDFSMPLFSGSDALRIAQELRPAIPFLFLSGSIGQERCEQARRQGAADCIEKGDAEELAIALRRVLEAQSG